MLSLAKFIRKEIEMRENLVGTGVVNSSLEMAIENYLKPELLEGDN